MLLLLIVAVSGVAAYSLTWGVRLASGLVPTPLGCMSDLWLAEYRACHGS